MNKNTFYCLKKLNQILFINIYIYNSHTETITSLNNITNIFLVSDTQLIHTLLKQAQTSDGPAIYCEQNSIFFSSFKTSENEYIFIGPITIHPITFEQKHIFHKVHNIIVEGSAFIPIVEIGIYYNIILLVYHISTSKYTEYDSLLKIYNINLSTFESQKVLNRKKQIDEESYHHSYADERKLTDAIKNADLNKTLYYIETLIPISGKLSSTPLNHFRNIAICGITLSTRAAIEGGANPTEAYRTSDIFIDLFDQCTNILELYNLIRNANTELVKLVQLAKHTKKYSTYVEQCKYYIEENYKNNFSLDDLAQSIGINASYLSHMFSSNESMTIKEYLNKTRVTHAQNLLKYSDSSLIEICNYIGFSTQSYFTHIFKAYTNMTPKQYRNQYKTIEFQSMPQD